MKKFFSILAVLFVFALCANPALAAAGPEMFSFGSLVVPVVVLGVVLAVFLAIGMFLKNYIKVPPNKVAVISGRKHMVGDSVVGFRLVRGGATFRWPLLERVDYLSLGVITFGVETAGAITKEGVPLTVNSVANVKIGGDDVALRNAAERFLGMPETDMIQLIRGTLEAHLRAICCTLTVEQINNDRQQFQQKMVSEAAVDLQKMGIAIDVWAVAHIKDNQGYLDSLGKSRTAQVKRDAMIGEAEATRDQEIRTAEAQREATVKATGAQREGAVAKNDNMAQIAKAERDLAVKQADMAAERQAAEARRDQAGPQAKAEAEQGVFVAQVAAQQAKVEAETTLQEKVALKTQRELEATLIKKAEADKRKVQIDAEAAQTKVRIDAEAAQTKAEIDAEAAVSRANGEKNAAIAKAEGARQAAIAEGMGEGEKAKAIGVGEAEAAKAKLLAQAEGESAQLRLKLLAEADGQTALANATRARLLAEADGVKAMKLAEADGALKLAAAYKELDQAGKFMFILQKSPEIIKALGQAGAEIIGPAFSAMGQGLANIGNVTILENGNGNGKGGLDRFAATAPNLFFTLIKNLEAVGGGELLKKMGIELGKVGLDGTKPPMIETNTVQPPVAAIEGDAAAEPKA